MKKQKNVIQSKQKKQSTETDAQMFKYAGDFKGSYYKYVQGYCHPCLRICSRTNTLGSKIKDKYLVINTF